MTTPSTPTKHGSGWHPTHVVVGKLVHPGPTGVEKCKSCGASKRGQPQNYGRDCGGSIDYDTRIKDPCPKAPERKP